MLQYFGELIGFPQTFTLCSNLFEAYLGIKGLMFQGELPYRMRENIYKSKHENKTKKRVRKGKEVRGKSSSARNKIICLFIG